MMKKKTIDFSSIKYIIFCQEHYNPLGMIRSLGENKINPFVIVIENNCRVATSSKYVLSYHSVKTIEEGFSYLVENFCNGNEKKFLLTSDDRITSFLDNHYNEISAYFYFFNAGSNGRINKFLEKQVIQDLAYECGFNIPKTVQIEKGSPIPSNIKYPIITKAISSISGGWKEDVFICNNSDDIESNYKNIKSKIISIQEYIEKDNELCLDGFSYNKGKSVYISIASTYDYLIDKTYSPYMTVMNYSDCEFRGYIKDKLERMFSIIGFEGIFSVEFIIKDKELFFLEINFRNSTWSYASTVAGANLPVMWAHEMVLNEDIMLLEEKRKQFKPFHAIVELTDFKYRVIGKRIGIFKWLHQFNKSKCKYYIGKHDIRPFFVALLKRK